MNQINTFSYEISEEFHDFDYSYGEAYMNSFGTKLDNNDMIFNDQCLYFNCNNQFNFENENKNNAFNDKLSLDFSWSPRTNQTCINMEDNSKSDDSSKQNEDNMDDNKAKSPSRTCSDTNVSLSFIPEDEQNDSIDTYSDKHCDNDEMSPEFEYECKYGDLNIFVDKILSANPAEFLKEQGIKMDEETIQKLSINKRKRKTKKQKELLDTEYKKNSDWSKSFMQKLAKQLGMSLSSIYKWHWDQKHKNDNTSAFGAKKHCKRKSA